MTEEEERLLGYVGLFLLGWALIIIFDWALLNKGLSIISLIGKESVSCHLSICQYEHC